MKSTVKEFEGDNIPDFEDDFDFAFIFLAPDENLAEIAEEIDNKISCDWIGCTSAGQISPKAVREERNIIYGLQAEETEFELFSTDNIYEEPYENTKKAVESSEELDVIVPFVTGFTEEKPSVEFEVIKALTEVFGTETPVVGGAAGDNNHYKENHVAINGEVYSNGAVFAGIKTSHKVSVELVHGYSKSGKSFLAETKGNKVNKLNGKPATEVYAEELGVKEEELEGHIELPSGTNMPKILAEYSHRKPFAVKIGSNNILRVPKAVEGNSLVFSSQIPDKATLQLVEGEKYEIAEETCNTISEWSERDIEAALVFECAGRKITLGEENLKEVKTIQNSLGDNFAGFFSYGELGGSQEDFCTSNFLTVTAIMFEPS